MYIYIKKENERKWICIYEYIEKKNKQYKIEKYYIYNEIPIMMLRVLFDMKYIFLNFVLINMNFYKGNIRYVLCLMNWVYVEISYYFLKISFLMKIEIQYLMDPIGRILDFFFPIVEFWNITIIYNKTSNRYLDLFRWYFL